jgi:hypothetical protein
MYPKRSLVQKRRAVSTRSNMLLTYIEHINPMDEASAANKIDNLYLCISHGSLAPSQDDIKK